MKPVNLLIVNCFLLFLCTAPCANAMGLRDLFKSVKGLFSKKRIKKKVKRSHLELIWLHRKKVKPIGNLIFNIWLNCIQCPKKVRNI